MLWQPRGQPTSLGSPSTAPPANPGVIIPLHEQFWAPQFRKNVKVFECIQRKATKLVVKLEGMSCKKHLRALGLSSVEKGRLMDNFMTPYSLLRRGREVLTSSAWYPVMGCLVSFSREVQTCHKEAFPHM